MVDIGDITFVINRSIRQCIFDYESSFIGDYGPAKKTVLAEFALLEIFPYDDEIALSFLLFLASNRVFSHVACEYGISVNGRCRGPATRLMINLGVWRLFAVRDLEPAYTTFLDGRAKKNLNFSTEKEKQISSIDKLDEIVLKRMLGQKGRKDGLLLHITGIYAKIDNLNELIKEMGSDQIEMCDTIDSLKKLIQREQKKTENAKRSISAQKGMITKRLNALDLETTNRNMEWLQSTSQIAKHRGYNKMIATKNSNKLQKEMKIIKKNEMEIATSKISLPLLIFDCLKESISLLNVHNNNKKLRSALSILIPLIIPSTSKRTEQNHSNHSIGNLLGFNEKSRIAKHYFERSNEVHKLKLISKEFLTVKMIEDV